MKRFDVIVIGGGAAGLFCAIEAGKRGRSVLVLEHNESVGKKIRISGGGRCNFTNLYTSPANFISSNPHFCKSALARYTPADFVALVEKHGIRYHEKKLGQLFCDGSAQLIIKMLLEECRLAGVEVLCHCFVRGVIRDSSFVIETNRGDFTSQSLVVATGGLSIPTLGASDFGYRLAQQFGLKTRETRPALVPLTFATGKLERLKQLSGISVDAVASCNGAEFRENILLTHRGLSGPAILQVSSYWKEGDAVTLDLLPQRDAYEILSANRHNGLELASLLSRFLPRRFAQAWCELFAPPAPFGQLTETELRRIAQELHQWRLQPDGTEGYRKAEVTVGGLDTDQLSSKTMEVKGVPGLFFVGEVLDVTGHLGGYNFQWAWASGFAAGQYA
ncbi:MAG TPA: NAD(P)/FAD-dependent oxidoreductase [Pyrinomonadaceae bacterium]